MTGIRYEIEGVVVRFFRDYRAAAQVSGLRGVDYRAATTAEGFYVVLNTSTKEVFDVDGKIPEPAATAVLGLLESA